MAQPLIEGGTEGRKACKSRHHQSGHHLHSPGGVCLKGWLTGVEVCGSRMLGMRSRLKLGEGLSSGPKAGSEALLPGGGHSLFYQVLTD